MGEWSPKLLSQMFAVILTGMLIISPVTTVTGGAAAQTVAAGSDDVYERTGPSSVLTLAETGSSPVGSKDTASRSTRRLAPRLNHNDPPRITSVSPDGTVRTAPSEWSDQFEVDAWDPDGDSFDLTYTWKWWDDGELLASWELDEDSTFRWDQEGDYRIEVVVSDGEDTTSHSWDFVIGEPNRDEDDTDDADDGNDRFEPNDDVEDAAPITPGEYEDLYVDFGESDYYELSVREDARTTVAIDFEDSDGDLDLRVTDPDDDFVASSTTITDTEEVTFTPSESGEYHVEVYGYDYASAAYSLEVSQGGDEANDEQRATIEGEVSVDGSPAPRVIVRVDGEETVTDSQGDFSFGSTEFETGETEATVIIPTLPRNWNPYTEELDLDAGENLETIAVSPQSPSYESDEFMIGLICGDYCYRGGDHTNSYYMVGWIAGGVAPTAILADLRDTVSAGLAGEPVEAGVNAIGFIPLAGDSSAVTSRLVKFADDATPTQLKNMAEIIARSNRFDSFRLDALDTLYDGAATRLSTRHGVSDETLSELARERVNLELLDDDAVEAPRWVQRRIGSSKMGRKGDYGEALTHQFAARRTDEVFDSVPPGTEAKLVGGAQEMTESNQYYLLDEPTFEFNWGEQEFDTLLVRTGNDADDREIVGVIETKSGTDRPEQVRTDLAANWNTVIRKKQDGEIHSVSHRLSEETIPDDPDDVEQVTAGPRSGYDIELAGSPEEFEEQYEGVEIIENAR